ncbi:SigE family RNA polymerase sigma factor [Streptomyces sp. NPDC005953]|uniref:SigE family RNA polymerase sigma factor n=1 Tax=unclassified Streptomyces TaxID=2593676 RepID=UPI0033CC318C
MRQCRADEFLAFTEGRVGHMFRSACLLTGGDTHLAEDLVQETLGRMYAKWARVSAADNPAAYAQTMLVRTYLTYRRRRSAGECPVDEVPDNALTPREDLTLRVTLLAALRQLAPKDRAVLVLRYWDDRSVEETAHAMNVSSAAVRTRSTRALARLRDQLGGTIVDFTSV